MNTPREESTDASNLPESADDQTTQRQPQGRHFPGSHDTGLNADDNSGSGGHAEGQDRGGAPRVRSGAPTYEAPGNAQDGDVGGNTTSSGTGVSGGETGQVTL